ncbi:hypothetical protein [Pantoea sp.]|uniref:hypothetical protein n=1 Tax=Pantoea sp. TaxID=69393 RepID=UPI0031DB8586
MTNQTSGKELVSAGHAFAKAISLDTPLIVIAKMVSDLSTRLDCAIARGNALQQERDALAIESAAMLKLLTDISENHVEYFSEGEGYTCAGVPLDFVSEINMYVSRDVNAENPFPATDAFMNSVRADALESFAHQQRVIADALPGHEEQRSNRITACRAEDFAKQLRAPKGDSDE